MNVEKGVKGFTSSPLADRFWAKVNKTETCWLWTGANDGRFGYGTIWWNGNNRKATHIAWMLYHGEALPAGMDACHHCDVPACVRPDHLFAGTARDNAADALSKGRLVPNQKQPGTHCQRGHELTPDNIYRYPIAGKNRNRRACLACRSLRKIARAALAKDGGSCKEGPCAGLLMPGETCELCGKVATE